MAGVKGRSGGGNRKPTKLLLLKGTKKNRLVKRALEPAADGRLPPPPDDLSADTRAAWLQLAEPLEFRIFSREDVRSFHAFATVWCEWRKAHAHVEKHGHVHEVEAKDGRVTTHRDPQAVIWLELTKQLLPFFSRFGMTPADRSRVQVVEGARNGKQENPDDEFSSGA